MFWVLYKFGVCLLIKLLLFSNLRRVVRVQNVSFGKHEYILLTMYNRVYGLFGEANKASFKPFPL